MSMQATLLADGKRLHLNHGPIDLVIEASGAADAVAVAYRAATRRFESVLQELVDELPLLRRYVADAPEWPRSPIAQRMVDAVAPHWRMQVTPMAAVAGAVAEHILSAMKRAARLERAYVNNGGDIALHLSAGMRYAIASRAGTIAIAADDGIGGIATSGWSGRSFSLGIADSVTVLAADPPQADVAATLIANAVDLPHSSKITREPANSLQPDSDLGTRLVTTHVASLTEAEKSAALTSGKTFAEELVQQGLIMAAALRLQGLVSFAGECEPFHIPSTKSPHKALELLNA